MIKNSNRFFEIDILRGLAALLVMLFHFSYYYPNLTTHLRIFDVGATMPEFFFIISGFVIFFSIEKTSHWYAFVKNRFFRIFPTYWFAILVAILFLWLFEKAETPNLKTFLVNLTMIPEILRTNLIVYSGWTLAVELQFYAFILLIFIFKFTKKIRLIICILIVLNGIFHYFSAYFEHTFVIVRGLFPFLSHAYLFFAGILFYKIKTDTTFATSWKSHVLMLICLLFTLIVHEKGGMLNNYFNIYEHLAINTFYFLLFYLFAFQKLTLPKSMILIFMGDISFCLYLIHEVAGRIILAKLSNYNIGYYPSIVLVSGLMILASIFVSKYFEKPIIAWSKSKKGLE